MSTKKLVFLIIIVAGEGFVDGSKVISRNYPTTYSSGYTHPIGSTQQKELHHRYSVMSDHSPHFSGPQANTAQSVDADSASVQYLHPTNGQDNWNPSSGWNGTYVRHTNGYVRPSHNRDPVEGSHSVYQYQYVRSPLQTGHMAYKKPSPYYGKGKIVKAFEKPKQMTPQYLYYNGPTTYKKTMYHRIHTPYTVHKYPVKKLAQPYYRRYYQMPYAFPSTDIFRNKVKNVYTYGKDSSTAATPMVTTDRVYNTDRNNYPVTSKNYSVNHNDTYTSRPDSYSNYYDKSEEKEQTTPEPISYVETSTRGYYGDRIYMNSHVPSQGAEKGVRHRYYVVRKEHEDEDDLETIFD